MWVRVPLRLPLTESEARGSKKEPRASSFQYHRILRFRGVPHPYILMRFSIIKKLWKPDGFHNVVGVTRFELATTRPPDAYSNRAELHPDGVVAFDWAGVVSQKRCKGREFSRAAQIFQPLFSSTNPVPGAVPASYGYPSACYSLLKFQSRRRVWMLSELLLNLPEIKT